MGALGVTGAGELWAAGLSGGAGRGGAGPAVLGRL